MTRQPGRALAWLLQAPARTTAGEETMIRQPGRALTVLPQEPAGPSAGEWS